MNNPELFIHIGYPKTGTTFLQQRVFPKLKVNQILSPGVDYIAESRNYEPEHFIDLLNSQGNLRGYNKTIISQETLSGRSDGNPIWDSHLMAQRLKQTFPEAKIIIVIRNQLDYILSLYTFRVVKRGLQRRSLDDYLTHVFTKGLCAKLQYDRLIEYYLRLFNKSNVLVLAYEQLKEDGHKFVNDILNFMNINSVVNYDLQKENVGVRHRHIILAHRLFNYPYSITVDSLAKKNLISTENYIWFAERYYRLKRRLVAPLFQKLGSKTAQRIELDDAWKKQLVLAFKESNHKLGSLIEIDLSKYGYIW
jgi:hypothetical protein